LSSESSAQSALEFGDAAKRGDPIDVSGAIQGVEHPDEVSCISDWRP
jgi:hypothetical protein